MIPRILDAIKEPQQILSAIDGYQNAPILPLDIAVQPLTQFFPPAVLNRNVWMVKERCKNPSDNLTIDESASIALYTMSWELDEKSLYYLLNETLRMEQRDKLRPWHNYLKLFLTALHRLPRLQDTVLRGVKGDLSSKYIEGNHYFWWAVSSCTKDMKTLECPQFCGKEGSRTVFVIKCQSGRCIKSHSMYFSEDEVLLPPGFYFEVKSKNDFGNGLHFIELIEKQPPHVVLAPPERNGIYIEGVCHQTTCALYQRPTRISYGCCRLDILIDLDEKNCKCPLCSKYIEPRKVGFIHCWWCYSATKKERPLRPPISITRDWEYTDGPIYLPTDDNNDPQVSWLKLIVEATEEAPPNTTINEHANSVNNRKIQQN